MAVLTEPIAVVKGESASTRGASLASIQPSEERLINLLCESKAVSADFFIAWAKWSKLWSARQPQVQVGTGYYLLSLYQIIRTGEVFGRFRGGRKVVPLTIALAHHRQ